MAHDEDTDNNRKKKLEGRQKRRKYVQGTRAFTHAMTNRKAKEAPRKDVGSDADESS